MNLINLYCRLEFYILRKLGFYKFKNEGKSVVLKFGLIGSPSNICIGSYVYIGENFCLWGEGGIYIGDNTIIGPNVKIRSTNHDFKSGDYLPYGPGVEKKEVSIGRNCWIGDNVNIVPGVTIGDGSIIGMGTTVYGNIPNHSIVVNSSMDILKKRNIKEYQKLDKNSKYYIKNKIEGKI